MIKVAETDYFKLSSRPNVNTRVFISRIGRQQKEILKQKRGQRMCRYCWLMKGGHDPMLTGSSRSWKSKKIKVEFLVEPPKGNVALPIP